MLTTLHYADDLDTPRNNAVPHRPTRKAYKLQPDVYAVQGYDAAQMLGAGLNAVKGDISKKRDALSAAMREGHDRQPARQVHDLASRTTRCRTSTCARSRARRTSSAASP